MTAFDLINEIRRTNGSIELIDDHIVFDALPGQADILALNRGTVKAALANPNRWACRTFHSHPTTPTLPCRTCGEGWSAHPPDLRRPYDRAPLLAEAAAIVASAIAQTSMERAS